MARHLLIVNTHSGGGRTAARVKALLAALPRSESYETVLTDAPGDATRIAQTRASEFDTLVSVGGDGTTCEVATGLLESGATGTRLAILPTGTGNDTAHGVGVPDWAAGVSSLCGDAVRMVDVCEVVYTLAGERRRRLSLVGTGVGYPAEVVARATKRVKRVLRHWAYYYAAVTAAAGFRCPVMRITADGQSWEGRFLMAAVANVEYTGGQRMRMAPGARCDDGLMHVILIRNASKPRLLSQLPRLANGSHIDLPEIVHCTARDLTVESEPPARLNIDGDLEGTTPVSFHLRPGVLPVRVPDLSISAQAG